MPCTQPQPQSPNPSLSLHRPIITAPGQVNDPVRQIPRTNQTNPPRRTRHNVRHVRVLAVRNRRRAPIHLHGAKRRGNSRTARYATLRTGSRHATLRCAPADPAVTITRRGDVAGWPCLAAALCVREYEGEYGAGCGYTF
jgi:hypothetical protein